MAIIFCFRSKEDEEDVNSTSGYSVKNTTSGFIWSCDSLLLPSPDSLIMVVVPKSIFSVTDDDNTIELTTNSDVKVVGIHLLYKTETETIADVLEKPAIDIDALKLIDPILHDIFLDIACFFVGWQKNNVVQLLGTYYTNVHHNIDILQNRCLLKINDQDRLEMDDLHQYQGRKIACNNSLEEPEKHSRLWLSIDIYDVLMNHKGTEVIQYHARLTTKSMHLRENLLQLIHLKG
ncbi:disease resistance protein L6-like [Apium graveolens]|uniref:disease resistance protein L6-like n=1 Tax=Apium graveolens TaxID=4045 RepID=UPI003D78C1C4